MVEILAWDNSQAKMSASLGKNTDVSRPRDALMGVKKGGETYVKNRCSLMVLGGGKSLGHGPETKKSVRTNTPAGVNLRVSTMHFTTWHSRATPGGARCGA